MGTGESVDAHASGTRPGCAKIAGGGDDPDATPLVPTGVAQGGSALEPRIEGPQGAPLVVVHADLSCPDCALALERLSRIHVRIDLRHFVLRSRGEPAMRAATAAEAAGVQGAFWPFARQLLADQGRHDPPHLWALAASLGLDVDRFDEERRGETVRARIALETRAAMVGGATGVPAVFADAPVAEHLHRSGYDHEVRIRRQT